ncbi:glycosyl hydrolase family 8 [Cesiribacter sp. SM1]|uniref:glycosyl hydrolase family 8 n=1 Tax=Cesiribacter sp. SM1 TaxID=2861196 RepID=UPI001CD4E5A2|nr:glycosyl hydrolase family 8 [Cesiribacter sp. SM1]
MNQILHYALYLLILLSIISCEKEEDPAQVEEIQTTSVKITVKSSTGELVPGVTVYLFDQPTTAASGKDPGNALKSAVTNTNGVATLDVRSLTAFQAGGTFYITVLEQLFSNEYNVLGTVDVVSGDVDTIEEELVIASPSLSYDYGYIPTTITSELALSEYNRWKRTQVVACGNGLRVIADPSRETFVEAMGFGTLLAAYANDRETFDGLLRFYKSKRTPESKGMMGWKVTCDGIVDPGSATDGDVDVAFALIVASKQWNDQAYLEDAKEILQIVKDNVFFQCTVNGRNVLVLGPGYSGVAWGGCGMMDIMYHTPAFFRVFAEVTGDDAWATLAEDTYTLLNAGANATTGLVPDWQTASGNPGPGGRAGHFGYDACRAPWRLTLDYLWNGNQQAKAWSAKVSNWANEVGPANIVDGYELNGRPIGTNGLNSAFLGGFAVATMSNDQAMVNRFSTELSKLNDNYWFNLNTRCLYLFTLTGNFWNPLDR